MFHIKKWICDLSCFHYIIQVLFHFASQTSDKGLLCHKLMLSWPMKHPCKKYFIISFFAIIDWTFLTKPLVVLACRLLGPGSTFAKPIGHRQLSALEEDKNKKRKLKTTRQSKHCGFCIYLFDNSYDQSKSMVRFVRAEKMVLSGLVFARKIVRMTLIQNI